MVHGLVHGSWISNAVYGTTNAGYGTTNADAGVGIGMKKRGFENLEKTIN